MTSSEKHMETAREIASWKPAPQNKEFCVEVIARALAKAERDGMKRSAEIAREHKYSASQWGRVDDELKGGNRRAEEIAAAILSEAGEE